MIVFQVLEVWYSERNTENTMLDLYWAMLNRVMSHYVPQWPTMTHNNPKYSHYDPRLGKLFYNDPK